MRIREDSAATMYEQMVTSRCYEEAMLAAYMEGKTPVFNMGKGPVPGEMHLSNGQEPCAVGVCAHLNDDDVVTAGHRPHHVAIAKGVDLNRMTAEIFGKASGLSAGKGGHMHLFDADVNFACAGIIAQGMGPAVGAALASKLQGHQKVAVAFIGEGAANQGAFHESLNLAAVWKLPFVCIIEDNAWGISVAKGEATAVADNHVRAAAYSMHGARVDSNDPIEIWEVAGEAIDRARSGDGPSLIELKTLRLEGHFVGDSQGYRSPEELADAKANDPIPKFRNLLQSRFSLTEERCVAIEKAAEAAVNNAFEFARNAAYPEPVDTLDNVFV